MHIGVIDFEGTMQGPIAEDNTSKLDVDWNGAIAFLDRDGVLNYGSPNYINSPEELEIIPGAKEAIEDLRNLGFKIAITTNQSAIMRGLWGEKPAPIHPLDLMVGDRDSDMGAGWAVGARLFQVDENIGISQIIERIKNNDSGDTFCPV